MPSRSQSALPPRAGGPRAGGADTLRLFVALWPSERTRVAAVEAQRAVDWPAGAHLGRPEGLHITLAFIGAVAADDLARVTRAISVPSADVEMRLDRLQMWGGGSAVLGASAVPAALIELHARLHESLRAAGFAVDARPFAPHLTLARRAKGAVWNRMPAVPWRSLGHVLVVSAQGRYSVLSHH